jgi:putative transport protein
MVRQKDQNVILTQDVILNAGDGLMIVADEQRAIAETAERLGKSTLVHCRGPFQLDYLRVFVGKANLVGILLARSPCRAAFRPHTMFAATTWTSYRRRI